jgi:phosphoglycerate kinase
MEKELQFLGKVINKPSRPFHAIIGGAKISSKIGTLTNLFKKVDVLYIAGAMAYTFFKAEGIAIGETLYEEAYIDIARRLLEESRHGRVLLQLPIDHVISNRLDGSGEVQTVDVSAGVPAGWYAVDIGPKTLEQFKDKLQQAATILWNGPAGIYEIPRFALGTNELAKIVAGCRALVVVGGGDSVAAVQASGVADQIAHLSTGGGATLEFLEYGSLPGIESLTPASASGIGNRTS